MNSIEKSAAAIIGMIKNPALNIKDGDYIQDGLLYCGQCNTAKQVRLSYPPGMIRNCLCECQTKARDEKEQQDKEYKKRENIQKLKSIAFPHISEERYMQWTFEKDKYKTNASKIALGYAQNFSKFLREGRGIMFYGDKGTGKSFLAKCIVNYITNNEYSALFTGFSKIEKALFSAEDKQEYMDELSKYSLLVLDDLGTERNSKYMNEIAFSVINDRYYIGKPVIVTTNLTSQDLNDETNIETSRIYSRLSEMCILVKMKGGDIRKKIALQKSNEILDLIKNEKD